MQAVGTRAFVRFFAAGVIIVLLGAGASRVEPPADPVGLLDFLPIADPTRGDPTGAPTSGDPPSDPDPSAPGARLTRAQAELDALSARPQTTRLLTPLAHRVAKARAEYFGGETDISQVMTLLTTAVREAVRVRATDADTRSRLQRVTGELTASSQRIAQRWLAIAATAGADRAVLARAQAAYDAGIGDLGSGDPAGAVGKFAVAFDTISSGIKWDIRRFFDRLVARFADQTTGLQFVMSHKGTFYDGFWTGYERMPQEDQFAPSDMNSIDPLDIASVSKIITTVAVLQLLNQRNLSVDSKIAPWLPPHWDKGVGVSDLTFRDLLIHRSGLSKNGYCCLGWGDARTHIDLGVEYDPDPDDPSLMREVYLNLNFVLLATAMGRLDPATEAELNDVDFESLGTGEGEAGDLTYHDMVAAAYESYVYDNVLEPADVFHLFADATCVDNTASPALYYDFNDPTAKGQTINLTGISCAYGGWHLSTSGLVMFMNALRYTQKLLPKPTRDQMFQQVLGWNNPAKYRWADGAWGVYHSHGGDLGLPGGVDACIMSFPNGTQVALLMNSVNGDYGKGDTIDGKPFGYQCSGISYDFDHAWIKA